MPLGMFSSTVTWIHHLSISQMTIRTRTRDLLVSPGGYQEWAYHTGCADTSWHTNGALVPFYVGSYTTMTDSVIPNFAKRRAAGEVFFNGMSFLKEEFMGGGGSGGYFVSVFNACNSPAFKAEYDERGDWTTCFLNKNSRYGKILPAYEGYFVESDVARLQTEVATEMFSQRGRSDSNLWETLAEYDQTLKMFERPISRLSQTVNSAAQAKRQGRFPGYALNGMSNLYLAYRYGIRPIVSDFQGIIQGLKKKVGKQRKTTRAKRTISASKTVSLGSRSFGPATVYVDNSIRHDLTVRAMNLDEVDLSSNENIGFTAKGLLTTPWELVPYSFVADWFLNIGDFIGAMTPAFGWNSLGRCMTTEHRITNRYQIVNSVSNVPSSYTLTRPYKGVYDVSVLGKTRGLVATPGVVVKSDFRFDKAARTGDAVALLSQRFRRVFS